MKFKHELLIGLDALLNRDGITFEVTQIPVS